MRASQQAQRYWALLRHNRNFRLLWLSDALAFFAMWASTIVLLHLVHQAMQSNLAQGLLLTAQFLPAFFLMPLAGHILDRYERKHVILASKLCNGCLALVFLIWAPSLPALWIVFFYIFYSLSITLFIIAGGALLPSVVPREDLTQANILVRITPSLMLVMSGGYLASPDISMDGHGEMLVVAILFFSSAAIFSRIDNLRAGSNTKTAESTSELLARFLEGMRYLFGHRALARAFAIRMTLYVGVGGQVLLSIYGEDVFDLGERGTGLLYMARGLGMLLGGFWLLQFVLSKGLTESRIIGLGLGLFGIGYVLAGTATGFGIGAVALLFGLGYLGEGVIKPLTMAQLQKETDPSYLARVMAAEQGLSAVVQSAAALVIAASLATANPIAICWASAATGGVLIAMALTWLWFTRSK